MDLRIRKVSARENALKPTTPTRKNAAAKRLALDEPSVTRVFKSPIGTIELIATAYGVRRIYLPGEKKVAAKPVPPHTQKPHAVADIKKIAAVAEKQIGQYLAGKRRDFSFPLDLRATPFKRRALLQGVAKIPYGKTKTYGEVAAQIGAPRAYRAVGNANATNPLPLVIPCHRVVGCVGLGGYGGGLPLKKKLLALEGASF